MVKTCEIYAQEHNIQFSTNEIPAKSKTKCLAFLKKPKALKNIKLNGNDLHWVEKGVHFGNHVQNEMNGMKQDVNVKRARYIQKNNEINQEFYFAHPRTKFHLNCVYNSHFSGSPCGICSVMMWRKWRIAGIDPSKSCLIFLFRLIATLLNQSQKNLMLRSSWWRTSLDFVNSLWKVKKLPLNVSFKDW